LAPFIAFVLWGSINGNIIDNYVHNYTGMYSWVRSTPGKTVPVKAIISSTAVKENTVPEVVQSPAEVLAYQNISFDPGMISYAELAQNKIAIMDPVEIVAIEPNTSEQEYFIIRGAFRNQNNAVKLINTLRQQGYPASVVDTTPSGLYVVSMKGFTDYYEAVNQLSEIKKAGFESSWILKKRRG
jgi:cell division protein FtsN